jgi:predicted amidohydrolase YtcJ
MPDPLIEMYAAVTRRSADGCQLTAGEGITPEEALEAHTWGGAQAAGTEGWLGRVKVGMSADLALLDRDPLGGEVEALKEVQVRMTLVDGQVVWER